MTDSITRRGWNRDRNAQIRHRRQLRARAAALLTAYLDAVADALATHGWLVEHRALTATHDLETELTLVPSDADHSTGLTDNYAPGRPIQVQWHEDTGWCVSHHLLGAQSPPLHHYLHTELVPNPAEAARFIAGALTPIRDLYDPDFAWVGMPYPAQFRYRSHPLAPVLDALEHALNTTADPDPKP